MFGKNFLILIFIIIPLLKAEDNVQQTDMAESKCLIHNGEYKFEYLYSSSNENNETLKQQMDIKKGSVHIMPLSKVKDFNILSWSLIETKNQSGEFYLKSSFSGDYLCASFDFGDIFRMRRKLVQLKMNIKLNPLDTCKWKINQVDPRTSYNTYSIRNVHFDEQLYAATYFFQREIFLWRKKKISNSKKFKWVIDCQSGLHLLEK